MATSLLACAATVALFSCPCLVPMFQTYTLPGNVTCTLDEGESNFGILLQEGATLDLGGYTLLSDPTNTYNETLAGVYFESESSNASVRNGVIDGFSQGIRSDYLHVNGSISDVLTINQENAGVALVFAVNFTVEQSTITQAASGVAMTMAASAGITMISNEFFGAVTFSNVDSVTISGNTFTILAGLALFGGFLLSVVGNCFGSDDNFTNVEENCFLGAITGEITSPDTGIIVGEDFGSDTQVLIKKNHVDGFDSGLVLMGGTSTVIDNCLTKNAIGVTLGGVGGSGIDKNFFESNTIDIKYIGENESNIDISFGSETTTGKVGKKGKGKHDSCKCEINSTGYLGVQRGKSSKKSPRGSKSSKSSKGRKIRHRAL